MNRRSLLVAALAGPLAVSARGQTSVPARVSLLDGGWYRSSRIAGVAVDLDEGWKTYWRVPGDAGIPPDFKWDNSRNARAIDVLYPLPQRHEDLSGESIGYEHRVVFPVSIEPVDRGAPVALSLNMFFGVCRDICVPQKIVADIDLPPDGTDQGVAAWLAKVPLRQSQPSPVTGARLETNGDLRIVLSLDSAVDDIFVETAGDAHFHKPQFSGHEAVIAVDNVKPDALRGAALKLTLASGGHGIEQQITLP